MTDQRDVLENAQNINDKIEDIDIEANKLEQAALENAVCLSNYEKAIAVTILKLKNGVIPDFDGQKINNLPATLITPIARGICFKELFDKEMGEKNYKSIITRLDALKAQLNGYQSLNRTMQ